MFRILVLFFILVPIIEIGLFIQLGGVLGLWPTIMLTLMTAFLGAFLVRSQGLQTLVNLQTKLQQGESPAQEVVDGILLAVAGILLLTPGFMTDLLGMLALFPGSRARIASGLMKHVPVKQMQAGFHSSGDPFTHNRGNADAQGNVFEGEFEHKPDDQHRLN